MKGKQVAPFTLAGMIGATAATRWVGATTSGPPTTGTFAVGDFVAAQDGQVFVCTVAGTPGTWVTPGRVFSTNLAGLTDALAAANPGALAFASDVAGGTLYRSNGTNWPLVVAPSLNLNLTTKGDIAAASGANVANRLGVGTAGQLLMPSTGATTGLAWTSVPNVPSIMPTGALAETFPRSSATAVATHVTTSGIMGMVAIWLPINLVVTSISFFTGTTALASGTHSWAALYNGSTLALLRQSTDVTSPSAPINTVVTFTLSSTFTTTFAGFYYLGVMWAATTPPTLTAIQSRQQLNSIAPVISGTSTTGLTNTAPGTAAALTTTVATIPYAYVS